MGTEKTRAEKLKFVQQQVDWMVIAFCNKFNAQKRTARECLKIVVLGNGK